MLRWMYGMNREDKIYIYIYKFLKYNFFFDKYYINKLHLLTKNVIYKHKLKKSWYTINTK